MWPHSLPIIGQRWGDEGGRVRLLIPVPPSIRRPSTEAKGGIPLLRHLLCIWDVSKLLLLLLLVVVVVEMLALKTWVLHRLGWRVAWWGRKHMWWMWATGGLHLALITSPINFCLMRAREMLEKLEHESVRSSCFCSPSLHLFALGRFLIVLCCYSIAMASELPPGLLDLLKKLKDYSPAVR